MGGTSCDVCLILGGEPAVLAPTSRSSSASRSASRASHADDRRRRRLDRLDRPRRLPPGRPAERGRRPRPGLLRPGRRGGDAHRRQPRPRPARSRLLPRRAAAARPEPRGAALDRLGERLGLDAVEVAAAMVRIANENMANAIRIVTVEQGIDPREFRAPRLRRRRPDPRRRDRRRDRHPPRARAAAARALLGLRRAGRAACASTRSRSVLLTDSAPSRRGLGGSSTSSRPGRGASFAAQGGGGRRAGARRSIAMRYQGQNYEQEVPVPAGEIDARGARGRLRALQPALRGVLRLPAGGDPDRARAAQRRRASASPRGSRRSPERLRRRRRGGGARRRDVFFPEHGSCRRRSLRREALAGGDGARRPADRGVDGLDGRRAARLAARGPATTDCSSSCDERRREHGHRPGHAHDPQQQLREHLPRDGHHDDAHRLLADLQRGPRLLVRPVRPATAT